MNPSSKILAGKKIIFLGSSVTYGAASQGVSFVDFLASHDQCVVYKEAVSGTTLVDDGPDSYISRMKKLQVSKADLFVCQLSTNDATQKKTLGTIASSTNPTDFDTHTITGAIEYVIAYARKTWNCPIAFYTNPPYADDNYRCMVERLSSIAEKWGISIFDLWDNESFNCISEEQYNLYMDDPIHPTRTGYLEWWLPEFERRLEQLISVIE